MKVFRIETDERPSQYADTSIYMEAEENNTESFSIMLPDGIKLHIYSGSINLDDIVGTISVCHNYRTMMFNHDDTYGKGHVLIELSPFTVGITEGSTRIKFSISTGDIGCIVREYTLSGTKAVDVSDKIRF